jgi:hypothetical protein
LYLFMFTLLQQHDFPLLEQQPLLALRTV